MTTDRLRLLAGREWEAEELTGGLSNAAFRVRTTDRREPALDLVVRSWADARQLVPIDRDVERDATAQAGAARVGPVVAAYQPEDCLLATHYVDGRVLTVEDLAEPHVLERVVGAVRSLHALPPLGTDYDLFAMLRRYAEIAAERGVGLPDAWAQQRGAVARIRDALARRPEPRVPCHNDLVAANMVDTGDRVVLIDFEYAGDNEPSCELAILAAGAVLAGDPGLTDDAVEHLVAAYDGRPGLARVRLWRAVVEHGWALWAALHPGFTEMSAELTERAGRLLGAPELDGLLEEVGGD